MKSNLLFLFISLAVVIGFFDGIFNYVRSIGRRRTSSSFRELYEDNTEALKGGDFDE